MSTYYVSNYRKKATGDDEAIRLCLDDAKKADNRTIVFDGEDYLIENAVLLSSNTTVIIDGCTVKQKNLAFDNVFRGNNLILDNEKPYDLPIDITPIENIKIIGKNGAKIEGPDENRIGFHPFFNQNQVMVGDFFGWRTLQISLSLCNNFEISGIHFEKTRCWALSFDLCQSGHIHDLSINSSVKNGDGVDLRSGCHHIIVENIIGNCSDDTVACTALSGEMTEKSKCEPNRYLYPMEPTRCLLRKFGEQTDISDIKVRNIKTSGLHHGIICLAANGCKVHNIVIDTVEEYETNIVNPNREATVKIYTGYGKTAGDSDISDIIVKNISGLYAKSAVYSNVQVKNVILENISHPSNRIVLDYPQGFVIK